MRGLIAVLVLVLVFVFAWSAWACPRPELGETTEDCPWGDVSRALDDSLYKGEPLLPVLEERVPGLLAQVRADSAHESLKKFWGKSINFDEGAKGTIVLPALLELLASEMNVHGLERKSVRGEIVHAGMEHTYGYLFSTLKTPFGFKRARWVRDDIEYGFGLTRGLLGPNPSEGTLLANVTYLAGRIAFRSNHHLMAALEGLPAAKELLQYDFSKLTVSRLEETVQADREVKFRTDLVVFPNVDPTKTNAALLVYSIYDAGIGVPQIITVFPVETTFVTRVLSPVDLGEGKPVISRYNAYVDGVTGLTPSLTGTRKIVAQ